MGDKKHIDRLFQEKFKDFEVEPREEIWGEIAAKLNEKKKKHRIIPIWWRYAGVAALLMLLFTVGSLYFRNDTSEFPENQIVDTESPSELKSEEDTKTSASDLINIDEFISPSENGVADTNGNKSTNDNTSTSNSVEHGNNHNSENLNNDIPLDEAIANNKIGSESGFSNASKDPSKVIANTRKDHTQALNSNTVTESDNKSKETFNVASDNKESNSNNDVLNKKEVLQNKKNTLSNIIQDENNAYADKNNVRNADDINNNGNVDVQKENDAIFNSEKSKSRNNAISDNVGVGKESDEDLIKNALDLTIEEAIAETKDINEEEKFNRWSIAPNAAPVYFNTLGEGSSIDPQFNSNTKTGDINMSYGIKASYAVNERLQIRSGINKVNMGYNTNNVIAFQSFAPSITSDNSFSSQMQNIKSGSRIETSNSTSFISLDNVQSKNAGGLLSNVENISLNQEFGFIEIPLEIQYSLLNKKLGVNIIGGFSSLFLSENSIYSESSNSRIFVGEANNINKISYSANFGLGLNYKVSKMFDLNLEPIFKYQINTFENTSGNFNPYFIGVYTGFAIKF